MILFISYIDVNITFDNKQLMISLITETICEYNSYDVNVPVDYPLHADRRLVKLVSNNYRGRSSGLVSSAFVLQI